MSNYDMKIHSNPDAKAWAKFFIQTKKEGSWQIEDIDESLMLAWFANAMMAMHDHLKSQRTWVELTDDDKVLIKHDANFNQFMTAGEYADRVQQLTEAKLKEKNNANN